jgi:nitrite reductase (NO-forming)
MVMALGWIGLTVTGTLVTLWPTMLRVRIDPRAERLAQQALPGFVAALVVILAGATLGLRVVTVVGLVGYLVAGAWWGRALIGPLRTRAPGELAPLSVAAGLAWGVVAVAWVTGTVALRADWAEVGDTYGVPTAVLAAGFAPQLLLGAMSYLVPTVLGGGPSAVRAAQGWVDRWAVIRLVTINGGLILSLLPVPSIVRVLTTGLVLTAYATFVPLLGLAIRASILARKASAAGVGEGPTRRTEITRRSVWSSGQFGAGVVVLGLLVCLGVLADPAAAGLTVAAGRGGADGRTSAGALAPTGHTTTVQVIAHEMRFHPASVSVPAGDRLVIELTNTDPTTSHDLVLASGPGTSRLRPGASATLDVGVVSGPIDGWCSVVGHRRMGMVFAVNVVGSVPPGASTGSTTGSDGNPTGGAMGHTSSGTAGQGQVSGDHVDLHAPFSADFAAIDPTAPLVPAASAPTTRRITLTITEIALQVAPGVWQKRWTFNGAVPGPTLRGTVGDTFEVTLVNGGTMGHSIDFHAGALAPDEPMRTIPPGASLVYRFPATRSGIWMYHCSTMPMSAHIAAGMHGAVIIDPPGLAPVDREYVLVQSEVYLGPDHTQGSASEVDMAMIDAQTPDAVAFNGVSSQYDVRPLTARVGERVRIWVLDAGPNRPTSFHVVGGQFDTVYAEGAWLLRGSPGGPDAPGGSQILSLAPGQGGFVELTFPQAGHYPVVSHVMVDAERGAHGIIEVTR